MSLITSRIRRRMAAVALFALAAPAAPLSAQIPADVGRIAREPAQARAPRASALSRPVDLEIHEAPLGDALRQLVYAGAPLIYSTDLIRGAGTASCDCRGVTLGVALLQLTRGHDIDFREIDSGEVLLVPRPRRAAAAAIRGRVVALDDRRPLASAAVTVVGTNLTVATDDAGRFSISNVPPGNQRIRASLIGFRPSEQAVVVPEEGVVVVDFALALDPVTMKPLDVTVSTGTLVQTERRKIGNAVTVLTEEEIENSGATNLPDLLRGRVPGVSSTFAGGHNGAGTEINVRGTTSFLQDQAPLVFVDGVPVDIGSGGLNRAGLMTSERDQNVALHTRLEELVVGQIERIEIVKGPAATTMYGTDAMNGVIQIFTKKGVPGRTSVTAEIQEGFSALKKDRTLANGSQYERDLYALFKSPRTHRYSAGLTGGSSDLGYTLGFTRDGDDGVVVGNDSRTTTVRTTLRVAPRNDFTVQLSGNYVERSVNSLNYRQLFQFVDIRQTETDFVFSSVEEALENGNRTSTDVTRLYGGMAMNYSPIPGWNNRLTVGIDNSTEINETIGIGTVSLGITRDRVERHFKRRSFDFVTSLAYPRSGPVTSTFSMGVQGIYDDTERLRVRGTHLPSRDVSDFDQAEDITGGSGTLPSDLSTRTFAFGAFAQEQVGLWDRLFLTAGLRVDGNSAFGEDYGFQVYPKLSGAYTASLRPGWDAKFLAAWGQSGKAPPPFARDLVFLIQRNLQDLPIERVSNPGNKTLKPELGNEIEVGVENYFGGRASLTFTYFHQTTRNAILNGPMPLSSGFSTGPLVNIGALRSQGIELAGALTMRPIEPVSLRLGVTLTHLIENGIVTSLGNAYDYLTSGNQSTAWRVLEGIGVGESVQALSYGTPWTRTTDDVFGYITAGSRVPTTTGGVNLQASIADRLDLYTQWVYGLGGKAFDYVRAQRDVRYGYAQMCCWFVPEVANERYVYRTDFAKLSVARISYRLPRGWVPLFGGEGEIYTEGRNLLALDIFPRGDPEANLSSSHVQGVTGTFNYVLPLPQRFLVGIKLNSGGDR